MYSACAFENWLPKAAGCANCNGRAVELLFMRGGHISSIVTSVCFCIYEEQGIPETRPEVPQSNLWQYGEQQRELNQPFHIRILVVDYTNNFTSFPMVVKRNKDSEEK